MPNVYLVPNIHEPGTAAKSKDKCTEFSWTVPVDNEHITGFSLVAWPLENGKPKEKWLPGTDVRIEVRPASAQRSHEDRQRRPDDARRRKASA